MKVYLINLACNKDRLEAATKQINSLGVEFERFEAVYGKDLSEEEKKQYVNHFRWWCAVGYHILDGQIGCFASHSKIYQKLVASQDEYCCILEDDVVLDEKFVERLGDVERFLDVNKPQIILLSNHTNEICDTREIKRCKTDLCSEGYVLTKKAAINLLKVNWPLIIPGDHWGRLSKVGKIELYHSFPSVCSQNRGFESVIDYADHKENFKRKHGLKLFLHRFKRLPGKIIDTLLLMFLR